LFCFVFSFLFFFPYLSHINHSKSLSIFIHFESMWFETKWSHWKISSHLICLIIHQTFFIHLKKIVINWNTQFHIESNNHFAVLWIFATLKKRLTNWKHQEIEENEQKRHETKCNAMECNAMQWADMRMWADTNDIEMMSVNEIRSGTPGNFDDGYAERSMINDEWEW
jgi:hypothetical protein